MESKKITITRQAWYNTLSPSHATHRQQTKSRREIKTPPPHPNTSRRAKQIKAHPHPCVRELASADIFTPAAERGASRHNCLLCSAAGPCLARWHQCRHGDQDNRPGRAEIMTGEGKGKHFLEDRHHFYYRRPSEVLEKHVLPA